MDFNYSSIEAVQERLDKHINPFTGFRFSDDEEEIVTAMMRTIHAAVHNYAVEFDPVYVEIPILELMIEIKEETTIGAFSKKISESITRALGKHTFEFSTISIQNKLHRFLINCDLIELRENKSNNKKQYFATKKGEKSGLKNQIITTKSGKKWHTLIYNSYMQAYMLRIFPEIFVSAIKTEFNKFINSDSLILKIEPLTLKEQDLILKYRTMNKRNKQLLEEDIDILLERQ